MAKTKTSPNWPSWKTWRPRKDSVHSSTLASGSPHEALLRPRPSPTPAEVLLKARNTLLFQTLVADMTRHSSEQVVGLCYRIDINNNLLPPTPADLAARAVRKRTRDIATTKKRNLEVMGTVEAGRVRKMRKRVGAAVRVVREEQKAEGIVDWGREVLTGGEEGAKFVIGRVVLHPLGVNVSPWNMDTVEFGKGLGMEESQEKWKRLLRQEVKAYGGYHRVMNMEDC